MLVVSKTGARCNGWPEIALDNRQLQPVVPDCFFGPSRAPLVSQRKIIVHIATSADGFVARPNGDLDWLTDRPGPRPAGFYGLPEFERSIDAKILGRKTFERSRELGARFGGKTVHYVFSRRPPPASVPAGVQFVTEPIPAFAAR